jgi:hypothetical protein
MTPSVSQRNDYCFGAYELCPLFYSSKIRDELKKAVNEPSEAAYNFTDI